MQQLSCRFQVLLSFSKDLAAAAEVAQSEQKLQSSLKEGVCFGEGFFLLTRIRGMGGVGETIQMSVTEMKPHLFRSLQSRVTLLNSDSWRCRLNMLPSKWNHFNLFYYFIIFKWPHLIYSMLLLNFKKVLFQSHYNYYLHLQYKGVYCSMAAEKASNTWFWGQLWHLHMMYSMWPLKSSFKCFKWLSLHCTTTLIEFLTF